MRPGTTNRRLFRRVLFDHLTELGTTSCWSAGGQAQQAGTGRRHGGPHKGGALAQGGSREGRHLGLGWYHRVL